jgi:hypothetical protein
MTKILLKNQLILTSLLIFLCLLNMPSAPALAQSTTGFVVAVPEDPVQLDRCGYQCVKPQSCVTPRPLACSRFVTEGNMRRRELMATPQDFRGSDFATRSAASAACAQALGADFRLAEASSLLDHTIKPAGGREYWVHNELRPNHNCWFK